MYYHYLIIIFCWCVLHEVKTVNRWQIHFKNRLFFPFFLNSKNYCLLGFVKPSEKVVKSRYNLSWIFHKMLNQILQKQKCISIKWLYTHINLMLFNCLPSAKLQNFKENKREPLVSSIWHLNIKFPYKHHTFRMLLNKINTLFLFDFWFSFLLFLFYFSILFNKNQKLFSLN